MLQELILKFHYDPACFDEDGNTILHTAIDRGKYEIAEFLIANHNIQFPIDHRNYQGLTAFHCACMCGHARIAKLIANIAFGDKRKIALVDDSGNTLLHLAAQHGKYEITEFLITNYSNQCPIDHRNCRGLTALHYACMRGHVRIAKLIANKAFEEKAFIDERGNTLLHIAAQHGHHKTVELLIADYGNQCPIDHRNSQGQTALHCACIGGHTRVSKFLVANNADITIRDEDGDTPLKKASLTGHEVTVVNRIQRMIQSNVRNSIFTNSHNVYIWSD